MSVKKITIEELPLKENSLKPMPKLEVTDVQTENVYEMNSDGDAVARQKIKLSFNTIKKTITIDDGTLDNLFTFYPGSIVKNIVADDAAEWICPDRVKLGPICLYKKKVMPALTYCNDPIPVGWSVSNKFTSNGMRQETFYLYPDHLRTQKELIDALFSHAVVVRSPFLRYEIEHPPEIQAELDYNQLIEAEQSLKIREDEISKKLEQDKKKLEKQKAEITERLSKFKIEEPTTSKETK
jgi:hypothetical protein